MSTDLIQTNGAAEIVRVEIDTQIATAQRYKRNPRQALQDAVEMATMSPDIAASCRFKKPTKMKGNVPVEFVEGPSVRLAEICMSAWGNIRTATRIVSVEEERVVVEAVAHDVEKNIYYQASISRSIVGKYGRFSPALVEQTINAAQSVALRNAVLRIVPRSFVEAVMDAAMKAASPQKSDLAPSVRKAIDCLIHLGATQDAVLRSLGRSSTQDITAEDLAHLRGVYTSIKDGELDVATAFGEEIIEAELVDDWRAEMEAI